MGFVFLFFHCIGLIDGQFEQCVIARIFIVFTVRSVAVVVPLPESGFS